MSTLIIYFACLALLFAGSFLIFRVLTRHTYRAKGRLTLVCSLLELAVFLGYILVPYLYNPPCWQFFWSCPSTAPRLVAVSGYVLVATGAILGFGSMAWLGVKRSFGLQVSGLFRSSAYSLTRNPQVLGGLVMVVGIGLLWPSWYAVGWVLLWMAIVHPMVLTEEEHLRQVYGEEYQRYCQEVPRYLGLPRSR